MRKLTIVTAALAGSTAAHADLTAFGPLTTSENSASLGSAGISLLSKNSAAALSENPGALSFQNRALELNSSVPLHESFQPQEKQTTVTRGVAGALSFPSPMGRSGAVFGIANREIQNRFSANDRSSLGYESRDVELRPGFGLRLFDELGVGVTAVYSFGEERVRQWNPGLKIEEQSYSGMALRVSSLVRMGAFSEALAWQGDALMETRLRIRPYDGGGLGKPYKPARFSSAAGYEIPALLSMNQRRFLSLRILGQLDVVYFPRHRETILRPGSRVYKETYSLYVPWVPESQRIPQPLDTRPRTTPRAALETGIVETADWSLATVAGTYLEPPSVLGGASRLHGTGGVRLALWGLSFDVSADKAKNYMNFNIGAGAAIPVN